VLVAPGKALLARCHRCRAGPQTDRSGQTVGGPVGIWRTWAPNVAGEPLSGGHFFPEQNPDDTLSALPAFLEH
jgi:haloacetate dehalogenase